MLGWTALDRVSFMYDLGVNMDEKMAFSEHVYVMVGKAFVMLVGEVITPRYPTRGTDFLRIDFHRTNYENQEPMSSAMRQFNEVIGLFAILFGRLLKLLRIVAMASSSLLGQYNHSL
jgi:hypothetical protein